MVSITLVLKAATVIIGLVVAILGCNAILNSDLYKFREEFFLECDLLSYFGYSECPSGWLAKERYFVAAAIITLLVSAASLVLAFVLDMTNGGIRLLDGVCHIVAGIMLVIASALLIATTKQLYDFALGEDEDAFQKADLKAEKSMEALQLLPGFKQSTIDYSKEVRKAIRYSEKLAAGALGIINSLVYFVTAVFIIRSKPAN